MICTFFHYQYSYTRYESNNLQMFFHLMLMTELFNFNDLVMLILAHQHEYQLFLLKTSSPLQNTRYAILDVLYSTENPMRFLYHQSFSIKRNLMDLLYFRLHEFERLNVTHQ